MKRIFLPVFDNKYQGTWPNFNTISFRKIKQLHADKIISDTERELLIRVKYAHAVQSRSKVCAECF